MISVSYQKTWIPEGSGAYFSNLKGLKSRIFIFSENILQDGRGNQDTLRSKKIKRIPLLAKLLYKKSPKEKRNNSPNGKETKEKVWDIRKDKRTL